jgi:hypothetical protein
MVAFKNFVATTPNVALRQSLIVSRVLTPSYNLLLSSKSFKKVAPRVPKS